ncbi:hypothetical protein G7Y89_g4013 [Cudoniella acicularis]|uniref:CHAT domain-containing protein n=1 Tax=Cudoniella acicularis TaxID=354080 RepID=A0A8H4RQA5_9HELO|nr:hypothetical protein G7Y89_g4013 [Cudoniella acicularis]
MPQWRLAAFPGTSHATHIQRLQMVEKPHIHHFQELEILALDHNSQPVRLKTAWCVHILTGAPFIAMSLFRKPSSNAIKAPDSHTIIIQQVAKPEVYHRDGRLQYCVNVILDDTPQLTNHTFYDPSSIADHDSCLTYLNEMLKEGRKYDPDFAQSTDSIIHEYGQELFKRLAIGSFSGNLAHSKLIVEIREAVKHVGTKNTIHRLRWEQLEDGNLWPRDKARSITVRRITPQETTVANGLAPKSSGNFSQEKERGRVNILLVIARNFEKSDGEYYDIDPGITLGAILRMKRKLEETNSPFHIMLEIVRPGTFTAFKAHLKSRPIGYFDIVHFDVHGKININSSSSHEPCLHFLHNEFAEKSLENTNNGLVEVSAKEIATQLHDYKVPHAVLNACKSANPFGAAVKLLCENFYRSFFCELRSFSDSASRAREALRENSIRVEPCPCIKVQDWFVPVTYAHTDGNLTKPVVSKVPWKKMLSPSSLHLPQNYDAKSMSSASSYVSSQKSLGHDSSAFLRLRMPDLGFERQLMRDKVIRIFGRNNEDNESYIGYFTDLWRITGFIDKPFEIEADYYLENPRRQLDRAKEYIWGSNRLPPKELPEKLSKAADRKFIPRPVVIVYSADNLFPQNITEIQEYRRQELNAFFEEILIKPAKKFPREFRSPYLIFVSRHDIQPASIDFFPNIGGESFSYSERPKTLPYSGTRT